ncbi:MAG: SDR family NAD(P)-dependent oxidoreductase, partial [Limnohabitans sp.]
MKLTHRIGIVTGAAQGIGAATVARMAAEGAQVIACDKRLPEAGVPGACWSVVLDVTDAQAVKAVVG